MSTEFEIDVTEILALARDLEAAGRGLGKGIGGVVVKGAVNVKKQMREDMAASRHFKQVAHAITYETRSGASWVEARVGPETQGKTVGDLAHIAYFGGSPRGGGSVPDPQTALDAEAPRFEGALADLIAGLL